MQPASEQLSAYLDSELADPERAEVEAWLARDPSARTEADSLRSMLAVIGGLPKVHAPPDFCDKLDRRLRRRALVSGAWMSELLTSGAFQVVSVLLILAISAFVMLSQLDDDARSPLVADPTAAHEPADPPDPGPSPSRADGP